MTVLPLTGGCSCGAARFEVTAPLVGANLVAMLGEGAERVANVRPAGGLAVIGTAGVNTFSWRKSSLGSGRRSVADTLRWQVARAHFAVDRRAPLCEFEAIAPQYPVFRVHRAPVSH